MTEVLHRFPCEEFSPLDIPDANLSGVYSLPIRPPAAPAGDLVRAALESPVAGPRLRDQVRSGMRVAVAVDDATRTTRTEIMLPLVLEELRRGGVRDDDVAVVIALGTHRPMSPAEIEARYTPAIASRYRIVNHDWRDGSAYTEVAGGPGRTRIRILRAVAEADLVVGVGQAIPHMLAGFGGGGKIINPGCADGATIGEMHWLSHEVPDGQLFAVRENAVREAIDAVALSAGLRFIVNEVPSGDGSVAAVFAGHPVEAHRLACRAALQACEVRLREFADIVVADAYPSDVDFWQAIKGLNTATGAVRHGGTVILVTPCPEGVSPQHPEVVHVGYAPTEMIAAMVEAGTLDKAVAANLFQGRRYLERAACILVTAGISQADTEAMGMLWAPDPAAALDLAFARSGRRATINVLAHAAKMVCRV